MRSKVSLHAFWKEFQILSMNNAGVLLLNCVADTGSCLYNITCTCTGNCMFEGFRDNNFHWNMIFFFSLFKHCSLDFLLLCGWKPLRRKANACKLKIVPVNQLLFKRNKFCDVCKSLIITNFSRCKPDLKYSEISFSS